MKKFASLLKATTKGDMNIFRFKTKKDGPRKFLLPLVLSAIVMYSIYMYADLIGEGLKGTGLEYILLTMFALFVTIITLMEGVYKAQGILFDAKDNNLLFSLPIKKSYILSARIVKLMAFEYLFELLFILPAYYKYIMLVPKLSITFYLVSIVFLILLPIIPTIISSIIGFVIKYFSSKAKFKKLIQTLLSFVFIFFFMYLSYNMNTFINSLATNGASLNELISKIYLPIGLYIELIQNFDILKFILLILINIVPFILFIYIFSIKYNSIINGSKEIAAPKIQKNKKIVIKTLSKPKSLLKKDIKKYLSSPTYVFNTMFGLILLLIITVAMCINLQGTIETLVEGEDVNIAMKDIMRFLPQIYLLIILFITASCQITASSISIEGKKLEGLKSLPIKPIEIYNSKILMNSLIMSPLLIICSLIFIIRFQIYNIFGIYLIAFSIVYPLVNGITGILINLKYPKLNFNSDVEVMKQSASIIIAMLASMSEVVLPMIMYFTCLKYLSAEIIIGIVLLIYIVLIFILYSILKRYGSKRFIEL